MSFDRKLDTSMYFITDSSYCGEEEFCKGLRTHSAAG